MAHFALYNTDITLVMDTCDSVIHYFRSCKLSDRAEYLKHPERETAYSNSLLLANYPVNDYR